MLNLVSNVAATDTDIDTEQSAREEKNAAPTFADFWLMYPRKVARKDAEKAWKRLNSAQTVAALTALVMWRRLWMARGELEFVPHAATWLHGERWEDELPSSWTIAPQNASQMPASLPAQGERSAMPDHVRALLASLRK